jgi:hypothetical protein
LAKYGTQDDKMKRAASTPMEYCDTVKTSDSAMEHKILIKSMNPQEEADDSLLVSISREMVFVEARQDKTRKRFLATKTSPDFKDALNCVKVFNKTNSTNSRSERAIIDKRVAITGACIVN